MPHVQVIDDLGFKVDLASSPGRIISLVPSWTETLFALGLGERVVGATKFCVEPAERVESIRKVGGTKNPDLRTIATLAPDLIIANAEENRREDVERMRTQGFPVLITYPRTVPAAVESLLKIGRVAGCEAEADAMAREITRTVSEVEADVGVWAKLRLRAFCPIWKKPWMAFNADTYAHDVLRMMGFNNVYAAAGERYPATTLDEAIELRPNVVLLPDEPYEFSDKDVDELRTVLPPGLARRVLTISGRDLHWYGVHMVSGLKSLAQRLARVRAAVL
ncbi:MAG TPA: helical backbone metal receptor [Candidatus Binataceae bacterium]|jgi:ABC-type Fe3+-hydroxamate transport system substrate-binding protein